MKVVTASRRSHDLRSYSSVDRHAMSSTRSEYDQRFYPNGLSQSQMDVFLAIVCERCGSKDSNMLRMHDQSGCVLCKFCIRDLRTRHMIACMKRAYHVSVSTAASSVACTRCGWHIGVRTIRVLCVGSPNDEAEREAFDLCVGCVYTHIEVVCTESGHGPRSIADIWNEHVLTNINTVVTRCLGSLLHEPALDAIKGVLVDDVVSTVTEWFPALLRH